MGNKAEYQISSSMNKGILGIVLTGELTNDSIEKIKNEVFDIEQSMNTKNVLIDVRKLRGRIGFTEAYSFVRNIPSDRHRINIALVDIPEYAELDSFHETTAFNAGLSVKFFTDIDTARVWIKSKQSK
jgi:hypothetical protein